MMKLIEHSVEMLLVIYVRTFLTAPLIGGFLLGRYAHILIRYLITIWIVGSGLLFCIGSAHGFLEAYVPGNFLFVVTNVIGQTLRARAKHVEFWSQKHIDWILVGITTFIYMIFYVRPSA
jgi:hypothetical protein